jgi:hypothetical protein
MPKNKSSRCAWLIVASLLAVLAPSLLAQSASTGALTGTVSDATGAVAPNVRVTATSTDTAQARTTTTGTDGTYRFGLLPPGTYRLKFEATGFKVAEVPSVMVNVTETQVVDSRLEVGTQTQEVTVQGQVETVQTTDATVGTVMTGRSITDLPLTSRNYTNLLGLAAGANVGVFDAASMGKGTTNIAVNGSATGQNNFEMDGVSLNDPSANGSATEGNYNTGIGIANPDAIQEFKIQTSLFDAGYGRKPGANVNVVTKSGTNEYHGTAFEFFRNTDLNANDFFRKITPPVGGIPNDGRQVLNQNQYGGVFGGPVKKDKLFFFTAYQESWQKNGVAVQGYSAATLPPIPTGDRSNTAAFQAALGAVFCPTGTVGGKTSVGGVQVACNGSNINPVAINLLQLKNPDGTYYIPSSSNGGYQNTTFSIPAQYTERQAIGNLDYVINSKNTLSSRWFYANQPTHVPFGPSVNLALGASPTNSLPDTAGSTNYLEQIAIVKLTSILTNNLVNEARISLQHNEGSLASNVPFTNTQVGIAPIIPQITPLDQIIVNGEFSIGTYYTLESRKNTAAWIAADQISWNHGRHTIRTGFEFERDRINSTIPGDSIGALTFQTFQDFLLGLPGCPPGTSAAACAASASAGLTNGTASSNISSSGVVATIAQPTGVSVEFRQPDADTFVQDDIKINPRLTVNVGLRWEYFGLVYSKTGELTNVWPSLIETVNTPTLLGTSAATGSLAGFVVPSNYNPAINPVPPVGGIFQSNHKIGTKNSEPKDNFAPRVGLAWLPTRSSRFVVRSGFGYFYDRENDANYPTVYFIAEPSSILIGQSGAANYFSSLAQPYRPTPLQWTPRWVNFAAGTSSNLSDDLQAENYLTPLVYEWNVNTQYEFLPSWVLELGYVGSRGIHQPVMTTQLINQASLASPGNPINGITTNTVANASLRVPYLGFAPSGLMDATTEGDDKFNSLQATVRKQLSHGLSLQAAYTWSKSLTTGALNINNAYNHGAQYGLNPSYRPQRLAVSYSWDLPFGHPEGLKGRLVNGWNLSGVTIAQDGTPLTIADSRGGSVYGFGSGSPETSTAEYCPGMGAANVATTGGVQARLGGSVLGGPGYLNKAAFCTTPVLGNDGIATGYGNSGIGILLGPGQFNWDMAIVKTTKVGGLREDATLQFRTEFFNTFNHPQFSNPAVVDVSKSTFGQITSTSVNPRLVQFGLKYAF